MDIKRARIVVVEDEKNLVLTDVHMRPMGGIELVRELRSSANPQINNIPVIFLSADSSAAIVAEASPLGVSGYLVKPPSLMALAAKTEHALKGHQTTFFS